MCPKSCPRAIAWAGFPGVVIALLRPDLEVTLIEPMERRIDWLTDVVAELGLDNAVPRRVRAQEVRDGSAARPAGPTRPPTRYVPADNPP